MTKNKYLELADYCDKEAEWLANNGYGGELFDVSEAIRELVAELEITRGQCNESNRRIEELDKENHDLRIELGFAHSWIAIND